MNSKNKKDNYDNDMGWLLKPENREYLNELNEALKEIENGETDKWEDIKYKYMS